MKNAPTNKMIITKNGESKEKHFYTPKDIAKILGVDLEEVHILEEAKAFGEPFKVRGWRSYQREKVLKIAKEYRAEKQAKSTKATAVDLIDTEHKAEPLGIKARY